MSKYIKISSISCKAAQNVDGKNYDRAVEQVIEHLRGRIAQVLPDRPDLLVLPECCDRPGDFAPDRARMLEYYQVRGDRVREAMREIARANKCHIAYSAARRLPDGTFHNSTQLINRQGQVLGIYNKNHLVIEEHTMSQALFGKDAPVYNWGKLTALKAKYGPQVTIRDPGRLAPVLIYSETPDLSARQMAVEFDIELIDDYFARALAHRHAPGHIEP